MVIHVWCVLFFIYLFFLWSFSSSWPMLMLSWSIMTWVCRTVTRLMTRSPSTLPWPLRSTMWRLNVPPSHLTKPEWKVCSNRPFRQIATTALLRHETHYFQWLRCTRAVCYCVQQSASVAQLTAWWTHVHTAFKVLNGWTFALNHASSTAQIASCLKGT